jgi:hypothetical protein
MEPRHDLVPAALFGMGCGVFYKRKNKHLAVRDWVSIVFIAFKNIP